VITAVQELGHLALAVVQAGAYIFKSECGTDAYLQLYQTYRGDLLEKYRDYKHKVDNYESTVYMTWQLSFDWLRTHSAHAIAFLQHCAFLHHNRISPAIFQNAIANIKLPFADQELNSLRNAKDFLSLFLMSGVWDTQKFLKVLSDIRSYSLIDFDDKAKTYSIHPLVHDWIRATMSHGQATRASAQCILGMSVSWKFGSEDYSFRPTHREDPLGHAPPQRAPHHLRTQPSLGSSQQRSGSRHGGTPACPWRMSTRRCRMPRGSSRACTSVDREALESVTIALKEVWRNACSFTLPILNFDG